MKTSSAIRLAGRISETVLDARGNILDQWEDRNLVLDAGLDLLRNLITGLGGEAVSQIGFGTSGTTPDAGDTALTDELLKGFDDVFNDNGFASFQ